MTLEEFAQAAGVTIVICIEDEGKFGYREADHPNITYSGFNTATESYKAWLKDTFGDRVGKTVTKLLKQSEVKK